MFKLKNRLRVLPWALLVLAVAALDIATVYAQAGTTTLSYLRSFDVSDTSGAPIRAEGVAIDTSADEVLIVNDSAVVYRFDRSGTVLGSFTVGEGQQNYGVSRASAATTSAPMMIPATGASSSSTAQAP
ncbi:MAG TPA: hypothetical protein VK979_07460 [Guyparkeria sp.]|nr:hypothetical protein [Guyparkeria sp.]